MSAVTGAGQGPVSQFVVTNKQMAEQAVTEKIREATNDPAKRIRELQQPSPFSQFIDIKA